jgi:hypothetical protein
MIGLTIAILIFNYIAFKTNKNLTKNQIIHIWLFTIAFQQTYDLIVEFKYSGYYYFTKDLDWRGLPAHTILIPPVNMMFLNWYPFSADLVKRLSYVTFWVVAILIYEKITLLPEPWGYFNYNWWKLWHSAIVDPILFFILIKFYRWIRRIEQAN